MIDFILNSGNVGVLQIWPDIVIKHTVCLGRVSTPPAGIPMSPRGGPAPSITVFSWSAAVDSAAYKLNFIDVD